MTRNTLHSVIVLLLLLVTPAGAQLVCINPGITIGHTFGSTGGFTFGVEVSVTHWDEKKFAYGAVASWSVTSSSGRQKLHLGTEVALASPEYALSLGLDIGPTFVFLRGQAPQFRIGITPYAGALAYVYYGTLLGGGIDPGELGVAAKYPLIVSGSIDL